MSKTKAKCYVCGKEIEGNQEDLIELGWQGIEARINDVDIEKFEACPLHSNGKMIVAELKRRAETYRELLK